MNLKMEIPDMSDRELLIHHIGLVQELCRSFAELKKDNSKSHELLFNKVDKVTDTKVSNKLFFSTVGILIAVVISLTGYVGVLSNEITATATCVENLEKNFNREHGNGQRTTP